LQVLSFIAHREGDEGKVSQGRVEGSAQRAESGGGVLGEGAASPLSASLGSGGAL